MIDPRFPLWCVHHGVLLKLEVHEINYKRRRNRRRSFVHRDLNIEGHAILILRDGVSARLAFVTLRGSCDRYSFNVGLLAGSDVLLPSLRRVASIFCAMPGDEPSRIGERAINFILLFKHLIQRLFPMDRSCFGRLLVRFILLSFSKSYPDLEPIAPLYP